jgi:hypothetical protein
MQRKDAKSKRKNEKYKRENSIQTFQGKTGSQPPEVEMIDKENDLGVRKGNKPKAMKTRYQERKESQEWNRLEIKSNAAVTFIAHNLNV